MTRTCVECQKTFKAHRYDADFCGSACRSAFNNRRRDRGAVLYDLAMVEEVDPDTASRHGFNNRIALLLEEWVQEDKAEGRKRTHKRINDIITSR